jgi:hypothetical protein
MNDSSQQQTKYHHKTAKYCYPNDASVEHEAIAAVAKSVLTTPAAVVGGVSSREIGNCVPVEVVTFLQNALTMDR